MRHLLVTLSLTVAACTTQEAPRVVTQPSQERHTSSSSQSHRVETSPPVEANKLPCEFCNELQEMESLMRHQVG